MNAPHVLQPCIAWTVAGSDSGGGAGLQADLRAFAAFNVHACSVVAALTAQNSVAVQRVEPVSVDLFSAQLSALTEDMPPAVIKTGMLGSAANLAQLVRCIDHLRERNPGLPVVVDPVLRATTGVDLVDAALLQAYTTALLPRATLITPNRREAAVFLGCAALDSRAAVEDAARALLLLGCKAVVITGGDEAGENSEDYVVSEHASGWLSLPRVVTKHQHGTGCVFASSAAAALALGFVTIEAVILAKMATRHALRYGYAAGQGAGPVCPRPGFASSHDNLPQFRLSGQNTNPPFAPLSQPHLGLYAVVDSAAWVQRVLDGGVRTVQLRIKDPSHPGLRDEVRASIKAARAVQAQLFINDHWQIAIDEGAYGVHLGQEDLAVADLATIARAGLRLGVSTHAYWEVCRAWRIKPSYIACGPIHPTQSKAMPWIAQGNDNLAYWCHLLPQPVVAIGGMNEARATQAIQAGAAGVAVISAITAAPSPEIAIAALQRALSVAAGPRATDAPLLANSTLLASISG